MADKTSKQIKKQRQKLIRTITRPDFIESHVGTEGCSHLYERHVNVPTANHIDRILDTEAKKPTLNSTSFESEQKAQELIRKCIRNDNNLNQMVDWLMSDDKYELSLRLDTKEVLGETAGTGVSVDPRTKKITEYEANEMVVRIAKNPDAEDGFVLVTAFPQITKDATPTMRDITPDMQQTNAYAKGNPLDKTFYDIVSNPNYDPKRVKIEFKGPPEDHHTVVLSHVDENNPTQTHTFSLHPRRSLFHTHLSVDPAKKAIPTDMIGRNDRDNKVSRFHNPRGMSDIYKKMPYFGSIMEYGFKRLETNIANDPEFIQKMVNERKAYKDSLKTKDEPSKQNRPAKPGRNRPKTPKPRRGYEEVAVTTEPTNDNPSFSM